VNKKKTKYVYRNRAVYEG
jgi:hypothetical protein